MPSTQPENYWFIYYLLPKKTQGNEFVLCHVSETLLHGPLTRYVKLRVAHAPGMPETFSPPPRVSDPDMHHGTCVTRVPWCMTKSLTSGFFWSRWRGKRSKHSRRMHSPQFYVSGKRPMYLQALATLKLSFVWVIWELTSSLTRCVLSELTFTIS